MVGAVVTRIVTTVYTAPSRLPGSGRRSRSRGRQVVRKRSKADAAVLPPDEPEPGRSISGQ